MKKTALPILLSLLSTTLVHAQYASVVSETENSTSHSTRSEMMLGVQIGPSVNNTSFNANGETVWATTSRTRLTGGVLLEMPVNEILSVQPELNYTQRGFERGDRFAVETWKINLDYLELPVLLKANFRSQEMVFSLLAGPSIGYLLSNSYNVKVEDPDLGSFEENGKLNSEDLNSMCFGVNFGASIGIDVTKEVQMVLGGRYYLGLTNAFKSEGSSLTTKNSGFQALLGGQIRL